MLNVKKPFPGKEQRQVTILASAVDLCKGHFERGQTSQQKYLYNYIHFIQNNLQRRTTSL